MFSLTINAETGDDLMAQLRQITGSVGQPEPVRTRRTKAEIDAEKAAEAAAKVQQPKADIAAEVAAKLARQVGGTATVVPPVTAATLSPSAGIDAADEAAGAVEEAGEQPDDPLGENEPSVEPVVYSQNDVREMLIELKSTHRDPNIVATLVGHYGARKLADVDARNYPDLVSRIRAVQHVTKK